MMDVFISGFGEEDAQGQDYGQDDRITPCWLEPQAFVRQEGQIDASAQRWIWLYRSPWSLLASRSASDQDDLASLSQQWTQWQRTVLKFRHTHPKAVLLVNRDRTSAWELNESLGLGIPPAGKTATESPSELISILGKLFEWVAPYFWDVLEALEAASWHPAGELMFRQALTPPGMDTMLDLLRLVQAGRRLPSAVEDAAAKGKVVERLTREHAHLKAENERLILQLHQVQNDMEDSYSANQFTNATLRQSQEMMDRARVLLCKLAHQP